MKVSNTAKKYILTLLHEYNYPLLKVFQTSNGCCGNSYALQLGEKEAGETVAVINDVPLIIDEAIKNELEDVLLDFTEEKGLHFPHLEHTHSCNH